MWFFRRLVKARKIGASSSDVLLASEIILGALGLVIEITSVLDGDSIALLGPVGAVSLGDDFPSDTHYANGASRDDCLKSSCELE